MLRAHSRICPSYGALFGLFAALVLTLVYPLAAGAESGPPPPGAIVGMKVSILQQLIYLCGGIATVMVAIVAFFMLGKCRHQLVHLGDAPTPEARAMLRRSITSILALGVLITGSYFYFTYYALAVLAPAIKLPRFAYMLSFITICATAVGLFMIVFAVRARKKSEATKA